MATTWRDTWTRHETARFMDHAGRIEFVAVSGDGEHVLAAACCQGDMNAIRLWKAATGGLIGKDRHVDGRIVAFSPDGVWVVSRVFKDKTLSLWDAVTGQHIRKFEGVNDYFDPMPPVALSRNGARLVSRSGKTIKMWDVAMGRTIRTFKVPGIVGCHLA